MNADVICKYYLTQVRGREEVREVRGQAGCVYGGGGVSLSWVMAESSRWRSLEQIGFLHVATKGGYQVTNKKYVNKLKPNRSDWIEYVNR